VKIRAYNITLISRGGVCKWEENCEILKDGIGEGAEDAVFCTIRERRKERQGAKNIHGFRNDSLLLLC